MLMPRLQRYVSDELTHFVGRSLLGDLEGQYEILLKIVRTGWLTHPPHNQHSDLSGFALSAYGSISKNAMFRPQMVCFCDIPVEDLGFHAGKYGQFGLSFKKTFLAGRGANPVFYIARNSVTYGPRNLSRADPERPKIYEATLEQGTRAEHFDAVIVADWEIQGRLWSKIRDYTSGGDLEQLEELRVRDSHVRRFLMHQVFVYMKFFDETLSEENPENYYMEREWRVNGNIQFALSDVMRVILPEPYSKRFRTDVPGFYGQLTFI